MTLNEFLAHFNNVKETGNGQYKAICPAHEDHNPSLSIGLSKDGGRVLLHCFAGCSENDIIKEAGLSMNDLIMKQKDSSQVEVCKQTYEYVDAEGTLLYRRIRTDYADGSKSFYFEQPNGVKTVKGVQRVPYNLPNVLKAQTLYFVEGEKCANAVNAAGRTATTLDSGSNSHWLSEYNSYFDGKTVIIIPDNDEPGEKYARRIASNIPGAKIVHLPGLAEKEDIYDWLQAGHTMDEVDALPGISMDVPDRPKVSGATQAEKLLELVETNGTILFRNQTNDPFVSFTRDGHRETLPIGSSDFKNWLQKCYYDETGKPAKKDTISQVIEVLTAKARFSQDDTIPLFTRVAEKDGVFWYDLTSPKWQAIKITADGWGIEDDPPVLFSRYRHQKPQVIPRKGGDIEKIFDYVNLGQYHTLFLCWLVAAFVPNMPHPALIFYGEKGAAKTTTCSLLKQVIDPSALETLALPNARSLLLSLQSHWFLNFDNISNISEETSDTLCRAITGGGIQLRKLFTDSEDVIYTFQRCISLNGINNVVNRADLLDRSILLELRRISEDKRREIREVQSNFLADLPSILGGIFDTLSRAMAIYPTVKLDKLPRMADFARWGYAIGEALGGKGQEFLSEYTANIESQNVEVLNSDVVATLMVAFMQDRAEWYGRVSDLFIELSAIAPAYGISPLSRDFPSQPNVLSRRLNSIRSNLEIAGISFESRPKTTGTFISVVNNNISPLPPYLHAHGDNGDNGGNKEGLK